MGIIISSFKGCGREYLENTHGNKIKIFDAVKEVSSDDADGYVNSVLSVVNDYDIVFIDASEKIRDAFNEKNIDYDVFYPSAERRGEFIENQVRKRSNPKDIRELDKNFEEWVNDIDNDESPNCYKHKLSNKGEFIGNAPVIMQYINSLQSNE